jgi:hypothetical protein
MKWLLSVTSAMLGLFCASAPAQAKIIFSFDYSMDAGGLFDGSTASGRSAQAAMERAGQVFSDRILDKLTPIAPTSGDTWSPQIVSPGTGMKSDAPLTSEAANVIKVYVGSRPLSSIDVAYTVNGFGSSSGSQAFMDSVNSRGQAGALATTSTDFGPWGGSISFDIGTPWYFGLTTGGLTANKMDFLSVAMHEIGHLLGFSESQASWANLVSGQKFTGAKAVAANGGTAPSVYGSHWVNMNSTIGPTGAMQVALMNASLPTGVRRRITQLDWAALDDLGWDVTIPGDANADGIVNFSDFQALETGFGETNARWAHGDFNEDGVVDTGDLAVLARNYGKRWDGSRVAPSAAEQLAMSQFAGENDVPEPAAAGVLAVAAMLALSGRRRRGVNRAANGIRSK